MIRVTLLAGATGRAFADLGRFFAAVGAAAAREQHRRRATALLAGQSDHVLRDLGLARGDVERVVRAGRW